MFKITFTVIYNYSKDILLTPWPYCCCIHGSKRSNLFSRSSWVLSVFRNLSIISVSVGVSSVLPALSPLRMRPASSPPSTRRGARKALTKMLNVAGRRSLVSGWNRLSFLFSGLDASRRTFNRKVSPGFLVGARHGAEEIDLRHRASPPELRRRVGNSVDHGQRWASRTDTRWRWTLKRTGVGNQRDCSSEMVKRWLTRVRRVLISLLLKGRLINSSTCTVWRLCVYSGPGTNQ